MRFVQLIALAALVYGSGALAADEASLYQQIRQLQAAPDPGQRAWLETLLEYRSAELTDLGEGREPMLVPTYPIAAAAKAALRALEVDELVQQLNRSEPVAPPAWENPVQLVAWTQWINQAPALPEIVQALGPDYRWPEPVLREIAARPGAGNRWVHSLLQNATQGASLRWVDGTLPTLDPTMLKVAQANPTLAETAWAEWGRRANLNNPIAVDHISKAAVQAPDTPGLAAGLALWSGTAGLFGGAQKQLLASESHARLLARVTLRQQLRSQTMELRP